MATNNYYYRNREKILTEAKNYNINKDYELLKSTFYKLFKIPSFNQAITELNELTTNLIKIRNLNFKILKVISADELPKKGRRTKEENKNTTYVDKKIKQQEYNKNYYLKKKQLKNISQEVIMPTITDIEMKRTTDLVKIDWQ